MCDTIVALPPTTRNGNVIFGKNSDRPQEETQPLVQVERQLHPRGDAGAQFVSVPEAAETYRHVGSKPYWCSGYEHGFNEHQVVIGNEALPTLLPEASEPRLIGMEILRIALERSRDAEEAVDVITGLVSTYGQGKFRNDKGIRTYDNSYLVADPREAYIVEAVGHDWAVRKVEQSATISNVCTLGGPNDRISSSARQTAIKTGLADPAGTGFSFSGAFADIPDSESGIARQCRTESLVRRSADVVDSSTVMRILSDHSDGVDPTEPYVPDVAGQQSVCLHRTEGESTGVSAASMVADLCASGERLPVYWCGMYSPCMTLFLPIFVDGDVPIELGVGGQSPSPDSPWWTFYRLTHSGLELGAERRDEIRRSWRSLQDELLESAYEVAGTAKELLSDGHDERARSRLTDYMRENFNRTMGIASSLLKP